MRKRLLLAVLPWLAAASVVHAKPVSLSLEHAVQRALESQPQLRQANASVAAAEARREAGVGAREAADRARQEHDPGDDLLAALRPRGLPIGNQT